jgi:CubicO group peptidase (beta-lactamase class C family)
VGAGAKRPRAHRPHVHLTRLGLVVAGPALVAAASAFGGCSSSPAPEAPADASIPTSDAGAAAVDAADANALLDDPPIDPKYQAFADAFDAERIKLGAPGASVVLLENGAVTFAHGFGTRGPNSSDPVRARTLYRIGSMTKALTATAFLSLVDEGKLDPKATLTSVVADVAVPGPELASLTLHELATQQSGLVDYLVFDGGADDSLLSSFLTSSLASYEYFMVAPGTFWNYSNPNFYLTGLAVERVGGDPYRQAMAKRVFQPLGMTRTFFLPSEVDADGDATHGKSTDVNGKPWDVAPDDYDNAWARPAGYAFSSVLDYAKFVQFLYAGNTQVLSDASRVTMQTQQITTREIGSIEHYGYGLFVDDGFRIGTQFYATKLVLHGGDIPGWAADFFLIPATGFGAVVLANADGAHFVASITQAMQSFGGLPSPGPLPADFTPDPATFPAFAATYQDAHNVGKVVVSVDAQNAVTISMPDLDANNIPYDRALTPVSPNNFVVTIEGLQLLLTFVPDATGTFAWLRSRLFVADRQPAAQAPGARTAIDPVALRRRLRDRL